MTFTLNITDIVNQLNFNSALTGASLDIRIVPEIDVGTRDKLSMSSISIYRQGD